MSSSTLTIRWLFILLLVLVGYTYGMAGEAIEFSLENWDGNDVTLNGLRGKVVVLTFSYSFCSVNCPVITGRLSSLDETMHSPDGVVYLHISIDPEMDTRERRREYFNLYGIDAAKDKRWMFLSGSREDLEKLWTGYGIDIERVQNPLVPEGYFMKYSPRVIIIRGDGTIHLETDFYFDEDEIAQGIKRLL